MLPWTSQPPGACTTSNCGCPTWAAPFSSGDGCSAGSATSPSRTGRTATAGVSATRTWSSSSRQAQTAGEHDRLRPGLNHLAFHAGPRQRVDELAADGPAHGWTLLFAERHPYAGGPEHYAAYLANTDNFEVELVAIEP